MSQTNLIHKSYSNKNLIEFKFTKKKKKKKKKRKKEREKEREKKVMAAIAK